MNESHSKSDIQCGPFSVLLVASAADHSAVFASLQPLTDWHLERAATFEDGLSAALAHKHQMILVARHLEAHAGEAHDGLEWVRQATTCGCETPLILLAEREDANLQHEALRAGAADVMTEAEASPSSLKRVLRFISERRVDAARLKDAGALLQSTLESAMDGILVVDASERIIHFNRKFAEMWRVPSSVMDAGDNRALLAFVLDQLVNPGEFMERKRQLRAQPGVPSLDVLHFKDGRVFERYSRSHIVNSQCCGRVSTFRDVSEHERAAQALLHSEARNATILQSALDCIITMDAQGRVIEWNPAAEQTFGFSREQVIGQLLGDLIVPPQLREAHFKGLKHYLETGRGVVLGQRVELPARRADGSELTIELSIVRIPVEGEPLFTGYLRDITERTHAEAALRQSQQRYERMVANVPGMVFQFEVNPDGSRAFLYVSEGCRELFDVEPQQVLDDASWLFKAVHADDFEALELSIAESARALTPWRWEGRFVDPRAGHIIWLQGASRPERQANGAIVWDGLLMDVTERKLAEDAVRERAKYEAMTAALSTFFIDLPSDEVDAGINNALRALGEFEQVERAYVFLWNEANDEMSNTHEWCAPGVEAQIERLQGLPSAGFVWLSPHLLARETVHIPRVQDLPPEAQAEREEFELQGIESLVVVPMVYRNRLMGHLGFDAVGRERTWNANSIGLLRIAGEMFVNALERKRSEEEVRRLNDHLEQRVQERTVELAQANGALRGAKEEAEAADRAKSEFLGRMSHELRTPLNAILGFGQLLQMRAQNPKQQANVGQILKAGQHLLSLINEVLDIARIESGQLSVSLEPVSLEHVIAESLGLIAPLAQQRSISITRDPVSLSDEHVMADRQRLVQVLLNLLSNAVKYNYEGGNVRLECSPAPTGRMQARVVDNGAGLSPEKLARLFVPFDRLGAETSGIEGTGLGLALSKRLVEAMSGTLSARSVEGEGTVFQIELPIVAAPLQGRETLEAALQPEDSIVTGTVLVIEDNLANFLLLEQIMESRAGVKLLPAMQGGVGLELARRHQPDLILLDLHLPDLHGQEVLHRLRADPLTRHIPVVVVSADATPSQIAALLEDGARDYLTKPLDVRQFLQVLDENLQTSAKT